MPNPLDVVIAIARKPGYREHLKTRLRRQFGLEPTDSRSARLVLADQQTHANAQPDATAAPEPTGRIRDLLFVKSPYDDFDPRYHPHDMQGWGSDDPVLADAIALLRPARICEVGSWKGRSAIRMAQTVKSLGLHTEILCIDTWLGSPEQWLKQEPEWYESLRITNGMPRLYFTFLANVVRTGAHDLITPFPMTSESAAYVLRQLGIRFDLVYIDAAHEYEPAKRDIVAYYDLLADEGILIGDDYITWPGVTRAADEFARERKLRCIGVRGKFVIPKGSKFANLTFDSH